MRGTRPTGGEGEEEDGSDGGWAGDCGLGAGGCGLGAGSWVVEGDELKPEGWEFWACVGEDGAAKLIPLWVPTGFKGPGIVA